MVPYQEYIQKEAMKAITILFTLTTTLSLTAQHPYRNLVFEGAGIRGIAYSGAVKQLEDSRSNEQVAHRREQLPP